MSFRANVVDNNLLSEIEEYFTRGFSTDTEKSEALVNLRNLYEELGPPIEAYPTWHPLIRNQSPLSGEDTRPSERNGYEGLDHTRHFMNGFITCPYNDGEEIFESVEKINNTSWKNWNPNSKYDIPLVRLTAKKLDFHLYNTSVTPIMVFCDWDESHLEEDGTLKTQIVFSLFLEHESPAWRSAELAEPWESMRPYLLGMPSGARSSHFVNQKTGQAIKTVYKTIIESGASGGLGKLHTR